MKLFSLSTAAIGLILLVLNISGLFRSIRNEELYKEITPYRNDIKISFNEARKQWHRHEGETDKDFAMRVNMLANNSMAHYWRDEGIRKYYLQVPLWENYILSINQRLSGRKKYEFRNYKKAIERGVGLCSQHSIALKDLLNQNGIKAELWDLTGHVVVEAEFGDGTKYILDPNWGRYIPYSMEKIESNTELVRDYHRDQDNIYADHVTTHRSIDDIVILYEKEGNRIYYKDKAFEDFTYIAIWVFPILLLLPYIIRLLLKKSNS